MKTTPHASPVKPSTDISTETEKTLTPTTPEESAIASASARSTGIRAVGAFVSVGAVRGPIRA